MKNYRKSLPPLDCLLFFEAAARYESFTGAAVELFVSQAAVSKRVQQLEKHVGVTLFHRHGRKLVLTNEGKYLRDRIILALDFLDVSFSGFTPEVTGSVRVAANNAVSMFWLGPRIKEFGLSDLACSVDLVTSNIMREQLDKKNDLAIVYCDGNLPDHDCWPLMPEVLTPVAHPEIAERLQIKPGESLSNVPAGSRSPLLNFPLLAPDWVNWDVWSQRADVQGYDVWPREVCKTYAHTIGRALKGQGIALGSIYLLSEELTTGQLVKVGEQSIQSKLSYYLVASKGFKLRDNVKVVAKYLADYTSKHFPELTQDPEAQL
ncbi:LysR family transcriptional regulator [Kiloniella majae]|uniref:LysR family transcriptional regulator n=1 Tax=Kiloniella majae TaxID=1938558 RepID=UPI000A277D57|nr:LysR family transcriptional regulator [Kiloniella majae]